MKKKYLYLVLCVLWMGVIFWFSAQPADDSTQMSNGLITMIDHIFHADFMKEGNMVYDTISFIVRKSAHMSEYAVLGVLFYLYGKETLGRKAVWLALLGVFAYAATDEFHQLFVPGRTGKVVDVMIDTLGGSIGIMITQLPYWFTFLRRRALQHP